MKSSCLIIAGEKSGEEHAMSFLPSLKGKRDDFHFFGVGGNLLEKEGVDLLFHLNEFSSWGVSEVIGKIPFYLKAHKKIIEEVKKRNCKTAILIDFQTFNMRLAKVLKGLGVNVLFYVAPQAWAWKEWRVKALARDVSSLFTIIPFEKPWFEQRGVKNVIPVEHPVLTRAKDSLSGFEKIPWDGKRALEIVLLPGSRRFEIENLLPIFVESLKELKKHIPLRATLVRSDSVEKNAFSGYEDFFDIIEKPSSLFEVLKKSDLAMACSGTVTLQCALFQVPCVVCYKGSLLNEFIFKGFVNYKGPISLANIVHEKYVYPEFTQERVSSYNIFQTLISWLKKGELKKRQDQLAKTKELVAGVGLEEIVETMNQTMLEGVR